MGNYIDNFDMEIEYCDIGTARIAYRLLGKGSSTVVIDTALGSCSAEWQHLAEELGSSCRVLVYDRAGYGKSSPSSLERTSRCIASELDALLCRLGIEQGVVLAGHSQGGLYAVQYAAMYPQKVKGMILLDPATPFDDEFKGRLTEDEYRHSGVDKTGSFKLAYAIMTLHLGFLVKPLLKKSPPFYYYKFSINAEKYLLASLYSRNTYKTALDEYRFTHSPTDTGDIVKAINSKSLGAIPVKLVTHSSSVYSKELEQFGSLEKQAAEKIEAIWQDIMKRYLSLSDASEHINADNSGHFIHLTDPGITKDAILGLI